MASSASTPGIPLDAANAQILRPTIRVTAGSGAKLGLHAQATRVEWVRNNGFNRATIVLHGKRVGYAAGLNDGAAVKAGSLLSVDAVNNAGGDSSSANLFRGRAVNVSHTWSPPDSEAVTIECVGKRYDLFRHVIFGQLGFMGVAGPATSTALGGDVVGDGPFGGLGFFNALPCIFNPKEFHVHAEPVKARPGGGVRYGNARRNTSSWRTALGAVSGPGLIFEHDPYATGAGDDFRNLPWSAYDMVQYVLAWVVLDPLGSGALPTAPKGGGTGGTVSIRPIGSDFPFALGPGLGMESQFPVNVDIEGLPCNEAITKICSMAGYDWWVNPDDGHTIEFWRKGQGRGNGRRVFLADVADGFVHTADITNPDVTTASWNAIAGDLTFNHLGIVDTMVSVTEPLKVQNVFLLRKGWSDEVNKVFVDLVATGAAEDVAVDPAFGRADVFKYKDFETLRLMRVATAGKGVSLMLIKRTGFNDAKGGGLFEFGRRWAFDEAGRMGGINNEDRAAYGFSSRGLGLVQDSSYALGRPRPILPRNIQLAISGEPMPPRIHFGKYHLDQKSAVLEEDAKGGRGMHKRVNPGNKGALDPTDTGVDGSDGKARYPFSEHKGAIRLMKNVGGVDLVGGTADLQCFTFDPDTNQATFFPPVVLGTIEHDQGQPVVRQRTLSSTMPYARRKLDGSRFRFRRVIEQAATGIDKLEMSDTESAVLKNEIDESPELEKYLADHLDDVASPTTRAAGRIVIPTVTTEYQPGDTLVKLVGRLDFYAVIVGIVFDTATMTTELALESEAFHLVTNVPRERGTAELRALQEKVERSLTPFSEGSATAKARATSDPTPSLTGK